jgi:hypothetical protein
VREHRAVAVPEVRGGCGQKCRTNPGCKTQYLPRIHVSRRREGGRVEPTIPQVTRAAFYVRHAGEVTSGKTSMNAAGELICLLVAGGRVEAAWAFDRKGRMVRSATRQIDRTWAAGWRDERGHVWLACHGVPAGQALAFVRNAQIREASGVERA